MTSTNVDGSLSDKRQVTTRHVMLQNLRYRVWRGFLMSDSLYGYIINRVTNNFGAHNIAKAIAIFPSGILGAYAVHYFSRRAKK